MELRSFKVRAAAAHIRVLSVDTDGEVGRDLTDAAADTVIAAAAPLFAMLARDLGGALRALSYNGEDDALRVTPETAKTIAPERLTIRGEALAPYVPGLKATARAIRNELRKLAGDTHDTDETPRTPDDPAFWEGLYTQGFTGWELGRAAPPLSNYFAATPPTGARALVVGCGRGNEARMLADHGAEVTAIDIAPSAIQQAQAIVSPSSSSINYQLGDVFDLRREPPAYDLIVEHTCFCAIDPKRRDDFVEAVADALHPGGVLVGLFYAHGRDGGPPFTVSAEEVRARFGDRFVIDRLELAADSVIMRRGDELFGRLIRKT